MSVDLKGFVSQFLTPQLVSQLASTAGVDPDAAQKLTSGAIPAVLAALGETAATPDGAKRIYDAVSNADPDVLAKLTSALGAGQLQTLNDGADTLSSLIGANMFANLTNALAQYVDAPPEAVRPALGAISQTVVGVIGQQDPANWSDAGALANLFASEKGAVAAALPSGLSQILGSSGIFAGLGGAGTAAAARESATTPSAPAAPAPASAPVGGSGFPMWAIILIALIVIAAIAYWYVHRDKAAKPTAALAPATIEWVAVPGASAFG
jgi:hypothetical protein